MRKKLLGVIALMVAVMMLFTACAQTGDKGAADKSAAKGTAASKYPERPINLIVPFNAGGGTDLWNRRLAAAMETTLGQKILVSNMAGAGGATGTAEVWNKAHDGYNISGTSETPLTIPVMTTDMNQTAKDWEYFIAAGSPGLLCVSKKSGYADFQALMDAAKAKPKQLKIACTGSGLWFLLASLLPTYGDVALDTISYGGSSEALTACVSGETAAVVASAGELASYIKSGDLIPVANFDKEDFTFEGFGKIDSVTKKVPALEKYLPLRQWLGFMIPKDTPEDVKAKLKDAFDKAMASDDIKAFAKEQNAIIYNLTGDAARTMAAKAQSTMCWMLSDMGKTTRSPEAVSIPKP